MHPLVAPVVDALEALGGWKPPGPGQLVDELDEFLPGLQTTVGLLGAALADIADTLEDTPIAKDAIDVLWEMLKVSTWTSGDDAWATWRQADAADIGRAEQPRVGEEQYNAGGAGAVAVLAATAPADPTDEPGQPVMCTGMVACRQPDCGEVFEYTATVAPGRDAGTYADNAAACAAYDAGWFIRPRWIGCPEHPGCRDVDIVLACRWRNGDHRCKGRYRGIYPASDNNDAFFLAAREAQTQARWHVTWDAERPVWVGCPEHPRQHANLAPFLDRYDNDLARHLRSGEVNRRRIGRGHVAETSFVDLADRTTVIEKRVKDVNAIGVPAKTQQDAEELAAHVLRALGLSAPDVIRASDDVVYMSLLPGRPAGDAWTDLGERAEMKQRCAESDAGILIGAADVAMENWDRHTWNWLVDEHPDGPPTIGLIDHGACFDEASAYRDGRAVPVGLIQRLHVSDFIKPYLDDGFTDPKTGKYVPAQWADNPLHFEDAAELRRRLESTRPEFERLGRPEWHDFMIERAEMIERYATGTERLTWPPAR